MAEWKRLLDPDVVKKNLQLASLCLTAYEFLNDSIIERVRGFFTNRFDEKGRILDEDYALRVLSKAKHVFEASCLWLVECGAITAQEKDEILRLREYRNEVAHKLPRILIDPDYQVDRTNLERMRYFVDKIDRWWIEIEADVNPDFADADIGSAESLKMILLSYLFGIVDENSGTVNGRTGNVGD